MQLEIRHLASPQYLRSGSIDFPKADANNTLLFGAQLLNSIGFQNCGKHQVSTKTCPPGGQNATPQYGASLEDAHAYQGVIAAVEKGDKNVAAEAYKAAIPVIDSMITKGIVNKNKAARHKSRLNKMVRSLAA